MKIFVNDVEIDFSLEEEENLGEVYDQLQQWLRGSGHVVDAVTVDGNAAPHGDRDWRTKPVETADTMVLSVRSLREDDVNDLETIAQYFQLLGRVLREGDENQRTAVLEEYAYVHAGLARLVPEMATSVSDPDVFTRDGAESTCTAILTVVQSRQKELLEPDREAIATVNVLRQTLDRVEEIPTQLQTGGGAEAMAVLTGFSELVSKLLRLVPLLIEIKPELETIEVEGSALPEFIKGLNGVLNELVDAFSAEDYVLLGDLLEYEVAPRVRSLLEILER